MDPGSTNTPRIVERVATLDEYRALCTAVGWGEVINFEAAREALPRSRFGVVAQQGEAVVGMGRVVGDGAIFYYVQDVAVLPAWQARGLGRAIVGRLVEWVLETAPEKAFLGVFAAGGTERFYEKLGFGEHPGLTGMFQVVPTAVASRASGAERPELRPPRSRPENR